MGFLKDLFGPRQPCDLCQLGQSSWPSDRSASADWKLRGHGLRAKLFVCIPCRRFLFETGLVKQTPMLAMAHLIVLGRANRLPLHAYLQHSEWRKVWMHMLDMSNIEVSDEFAALKAMKPIEEEFIRRAQQSQMREPESVDPEQPTTGDITADVKALAEQFGLVDEFVRRKYISYMLALSATETENNWNAEIDDFARSIDALTESEIKAARTDFHQAILNRIKVALVAEGAEPL